MTKNKNKKKILTGYAFNDWYKEFNKLNKTEHCIAFPKVYKNKYLEDVKLRITIEETY